MSMRAISNRFLPHPVGATNGLWSRRSWAVFALVALLFATLVALTSCETVPVGTSVPVPERATPRSAEKAEASGEYVVAAREYERMAETAAPPEQQQLLLRSADALIKAGQPQEARTRLQEVEVTGVEPTVLARKRVLEARVAIAERSHKKAVTLLEEAGQVRQVDPAVVAEIHHARAQAELALNNPLTALQSLINREQLIVAKDVIDENQRQIWNVLQSLDTPRIKLELQRAHDPILAGWFELALAALENTAQPARRTLAVNQWKLTHPRHPAASPLLSSLTSATPGLVTRVERVALLLPLTSNHAAAAQAVRDGFMAMEAANSERDKPLVKVYDIGADPQQAALFYDQAVKEGAQIIVGPLGRETTDAIIRSGSLAVPTLLLSHTELDTGATYLFQFGLPPEQEAKQAAERAYLDGHRQAAVLYPRNAWGERMVAAFTNHWQRLGGIILEAQAYAEGENDYSEPIRQLLNISESEARRGLIERRLGQKLQFEPRPRQDIDFIFLAADARRGRLIKPQLNYHRAARLPVYATSHIFTGKSDPLHDADLDGVQFGDMPWMLISSGKVSELRRNVQRDWPHVFSDLDRLYALGMDSYAILPHLGRISADDTARFSGVTSSLSLDREGRLHRQLVWAKFRRGVPRLVDKN